MASLARGSGGYPSDRQGQGGPIASTSASTSDNPVYPSSSKAAVVIKNPQLTDEPYFAYPTPTSEQIEEELPPYFESENFPLGPLLDRLVRRGYGDLRYLLGEVLPPLSTRQRPKHIIDYAKTTRQSLLKYLAVLRWKTSVDLSITSQQSSIPGQTAPQQQQQQPGLTNFPTPHSNGDPNDTSPSSLAGKGKGKAAVNGDTIGDEVVRGKVTDARRIAHFMEHQNKQHDDAVEHIRHVTKVVEGLRERNPDLLTALALLTTGTYSRLPTSITEPYLPKPPLTNSAVLTILRRLNRHIRYRLRCLDYVPSELSVESIRDGQVYLRGGGEYGWKARMTVVGFGDDSRWWLTGVEWSWRNKRKSVHDPGGDNSPSFEGKRFEGEERQGILDLANMDVLAPKEVIHVGNDKTDRPTTSKTAGVKDQAVSNAGKAVDSPLVRLYNFLQHLSLSYQLEILFSQAMALSQGRWRGQLAVEIDRANSVLRVKYWIRPRPAQVPQQQQAAVGKRPAPSIAPAASRSPMVGGILSITLAEPTAAANETDDLFGSIAAGGMRANERILRLRLMVKWEIGEIGIGGGLKVGDVMDGGLLRIDPGAISLDDILATSTRAHAAHLTRSHTSTLLSSPRFIQTLLNQPTLREAEDISSTLPLTLHIPLPSHQRVTTLIVGVSSLNGLLEIEDDGSTGNEARATQVRTAAGSVNQGKTRLVDEIGRLTIAIIMENMEMQMRQLGWRPARRLALRSQDLAKADIHPLTTIFVPLPSSTMHYFIARATPSGLSFELLRLARVPIENGLGVGLKLAIGDRTALDLEKLKTRRKGKHLDAPTGSTPASNFEVENRDLKDLFLFSNALVAQAIIEQQLKERSIPYTIQYPPATGPGAPRSTSALAGMVPTVCVDVRDLLRDGKSGGAAVEVALPKVGMQIENWWKGGICEVTTIVQLRHQSPMAQATTSASSDGDSSTTPKDSDARPEGISFDPSSSIVKFRAKDISRCVPVFLEQWERLSKVIVVAGEVNRLNKLAEFKDVQLLSFDLHTATLSYAKGYNASITYTPVDDSYQVTQEAIQGQQETQRNPHSILAPLLSAKLNELTSAPAAGAKRGAVAREFIGLLKSTLPFLVELPALQEIGWGLVVLGVSIFRIVRDWEGKRYALDITLLPSLTHYLIQDAHTPKGPDHTIDNYVGQLTPISDLRSPTSTSTRPQEDIIQHIFESEKSFKVDVEQLKKEVRRAGTNRAAAGGALMMPPLMKLDGGKSLAVAVERVGRVVRLYAEEIGKLASTRRSATAVQGQGTAQPQPQTHAATLTPTPTLSTIKENIKVE
ncbi:hypothetical protein I316_05185 [Kwoniella heveanensis BCC8398]|uniref:Mediator of RNA polymerase II transcription subunit 14 n=1 Tax=Kwoniella heveanensis BCC8398 TaxID=1296120 RepID=A0A1B9GPZ7_9TREE|nr:hypothetical protein I316_05185 [Kwoniella heveanensis BCC8398]